ncbi:unnamed protein product [Ostreobium quekettii]|uniref:Ubiquitin-like domain-containing protein n=1 Tax=Ostreobium quekettii TaxID=121088 RepID=A0A8S1J2F5_9CHLO|nr:unnamed protein product [Ostreobium quekettii]
MTALQAEMQNKMGISHRLFLLVACATSARLDLVSLDGQAHVTTLNCKGRCHPKELILLLPFGCNGRFMSCPWPNLQQHIFHGFAGTWLVLQIIARIARLTLLNGATVTPIERFDCELRYMSLAHRDTLSSATPNGIDPELHPRMAELLEKHGPVCTRGNVAASTGTLQDSVVQVSLTCVAASVAKSMGTVTKRLPASMTLANLKRLAEKLFKLDVAKMALYMKTSSSPMPESMPDLDSLQLCDFDIQDGQEILVEERQA